MATYVAENHRAYLAHLDASDSETISFGPLNVAAVPFPSMADGGFLSKKPGLKSGEFMIDKWQDFATGVWDEQLGLAAVGSQYALSVMPNAGGVETAGDPAWFSRGIATSYAPLSAAVGDAVKGPVSGVFDTVFVKGVVAHPKAARSATGNGTAIALTGPTTSQRLYGALHVTAYSGITNLVVTVQSDDNVGFASPTTRLTFSTATGVTSEFASVAGYGATETHHRIVYTITGVGSVTFAAFIGVL
jgi:hypothetical protein